MKVAICDKCGTGLSVMVGEVTIYKPLRGTMTYHLCKDCEKELRLWMQEHRKTFHRRVLREADAQEQEEQEELEALEIDNKNKCYPYEIIENIYENPELLKESEE